MKRLLLVLACVVLGVGSCASQSSPPVTRERTLSQVLVAISAFNETRVRAVLIDRKGRRTGWNVDRPIREIPGVMNGHGTAEGITDENTPEDTTTLAPADTVPGHPEPTPKYYELSIQDSSDVPGLLHEGACELRLDAEMPGHVMLAITGSGIGLEQCQDTTSVNVKRGGPSRWRLSWKAVPGRCHVKISRVTDESSAKGSRTR